MKVLWFKLVTADCFGLLRDKVIIQWSRRTCLVPKSACSRSGTRAKPISSQISDTWPYFRLVLRGIGRFIQRLLITTLKLIILGDVLYTLATSVVWLRKLVDVKKLTCIKYEDSIAQVLFRAGPAAAKPPEQNPLGSTSSTTTPSAGGFTCRNTSSSVGIPKNSRSSAAPTTRPISQCRLGMRDETIFCFSFVIAHAVPGTASNIQPYKPGTFFPPLLRAFDYFLSQSLPTFTLSFISCLNSASS